MPATRMRRVVTAEKLDLYRLHKDQYVTPKKPSSLISALLNISASMAGASLAESSFRTKWGCSMALRSPSK